MWTMFHNKSECFAASMIWDNDGEPPCQPDTKMAGRGALKGARERDQGQYQQRDDKKKSVLEPFWWSQGAQANI